MKESVLDVLAFLFEHTVDVDSAEDSALLHARLVRAGFSSGSVERALGWLAGLGEQRHAVVGQSVRVYAADELERLDAECRGLLLYLEQAGVIDPPTRELVIDRALALDGEDCDVDRLEWVVLMVLSNQPGCEAAVQWMEAYVAQRPGTGLH